ncbi:MAG: hypothetical protein ACKVQS_04595 [Fimbriimonadaceae bacterium]
MPKKNTDNVRQQICNLLAQGQSLKNICAMPSMPSVGTIYNWLMPGHPAFNPEFLDQYRVARMWQSESFIEKIIELSKDNSLPPDVKKIQIEALKIAATKLESRNISDDKPRQIIVKVVYESQSTSTHSP